MILVFIIVFCALIALGFGAASAWSDVNSLTIPNAYVTFVAGSFLPAFLLFKLFAGDTALFSSAFSHVGAAALMFGLTYTLFVFKLIGGGDSKLISAFALWSGWAGLIPFLFIMTIVGGLLGFATLAFKKFKPFKKIKKDSWIDKAQKGVQDVPYGVAIFCGALFTFWHLGYIEPSNLVKLVSG